MRRTYCTYFDASYASRGLSLWESLMRCVPDFELVVLCLDDTTMATLERLALPRLTLVPLRELEAAWPELLDVKPCRTRAEYYFTLTPALVRHVLRSREAGTEVAYLDADLWFFADIEALWAELGDGSIGIIEHRFGPRHQELSRRGLYNVGLVAFRNDERSADAVEWWRLRCLEWCQDRVEEDRFADQKYLDRWPAEFEGVVVLRHHGANVAPWNAGNYPFHDTSEGVYVGTKPLLFYHFHRLRQFTGPVWRLGLGPYGARPCAVMAERVYRPYIRALQKWTSQLQRAGLTSGRPARFTPKPKDFLRLPWELATGEAIFMT